MVVLALRFGKRVVNTYKAERGILTPFHLYDQIVADRRVSRWIVRHLGLVYNEVDYAVKCGLLGWNYMPATRWTKAAYEAGQFLQKTEDV